MKRAPVEDRLMYGLFLCDAKSNEMLAALKPELDSRMEFLLHEKISQLNFPVEDIFPWKDELSGNIEREKFGESFLIQPDLFVRLRPNHEEQVKHKLWAEGIKFDEVSEGCLALSNSINLGDIIQLDSEAVVQDFSSQRVGEFLESAQRRSGQLRVYDCCAASGGKSILAYDLLKNIELTVSDVRQSILINLKKRFAKAGIRNYRSFVADLSQTPIGVHRDLSTSQFDLIICDAPCTGSGTWSRTPEQLYFFSQEKIQYYSRLQKSILRNVMPALKKDGQLLYITCSVFKKENEEAVNEIANEFNLEMEKMETLAGFDKKADTMFAALLRRK